MVINKNITHAHVALFVQFSWIKLGIIYTNIKCVRIYEHRAIGEGY